MIINQNNVDQLNITTRLLVQEALQKCYEVVFIKGTPSGNSGIVRCVKNDKEILFKSLNTALTPSYAVFAAEDKYQTYNLLKCADLPTPETVVITPSDGYESASALKILKQAKEVVVKPVATNHGDGITVGVKTKEELYKAVDYAHKTENSKTDVIVQEMVYGKEYRFLVLQNKVIAVAHRVPPSVKGDGLLSISKLIDIKNKDPRRGTGHKAELTLIDKSVVAEVFGRKYLDIIPEDGVEMPVLKTSNLSQGGESVDCTDIVSDEVKKIAVRAAQITGLGIAGVDVITTDIENASADNSWVIEVNVSPGIRMHQFPAQGKPRNVAKKLFKAIEGTSRVIGKTMTHVGRVENIKLPDISSDRIKARIDTGATISSLWASDIHAKNDGLHFKLFGKTSPSYTGEDLVFPEYSTRLVRSSNGQEEERYQVSMTVVLKGRKIKTRFTLADRSSQIYPVLLGRNVLRKKFIVDVVKGHPDTMAERERKEALEK